MIDGGIGARTRASLPFAHRCRRRGGGVAPLAEAVDERLRHVLDHGEAAGEIAVEGRVADRHLRLVAGREHEPAKLVGERHQQVAADPGLEVLLGQVGLVTGELGVECLRVGVHDGLDPQLVRADAQRGGECARVVLGGGGGVGGGHDRRAHALGAERVGGQAGDERGVDPPGEAEDDVGEAVLLDVVAQSEHQRRVDLGLFGRDRLGQARGGSVEPRERGTGLEARRRGALCRLCRRRGIGR